MFVDIFNTDKKYKIIYADPPWQYRVWSKAGLGRSAESHYQTMDIKDIKQLPVGKISNQDSILFLWVTAPMLHTGLDLIYSWGFEYKTVAFAWVKLNKVSNSLFWGMGHYTRSNIELCLLATKGKPLQRISKSVHQVVISRIREHSRKPDEVRNRIENLFGDVEKIELFSRETFKNWDCWGDQVNLFNKNNKGEKVNE